VSCKSDWSGDINPLSNPPHELVQKCVLRWHAGHRNTVLMLDGFLSADVGERRVTGENTLPPQCLFNPKKLVVFGHPIRT
jgi:hypothetical protein